MRDFPGRKFYEVLRLHLPAATLWLLIVNLGIFLLMVLVPPLAVWLVEAGAARSDLVLGGQVWRLVTYMFLHGGPGHVFSNMLAIYFFAQHLERFYGTRRFCVFYFACGVGAGIFHTLIGFFRGGPEAAAFMIGASGAIYGVLCAMAWHFPNQIVYIQFLFPIQMKYLVWIFGLLEFLGSVGQSGSGISHVTHLGGLLTALAILLWPRFKNRFPGGGRRKGRVANIYDDPHWKLDQ